MGSLGAHRGRLVKSGSHGFTGAGVGVVGVIRVRVGSLGRAHGTLGSFVF